MLPGASKYAGDYPIVATSLKNLCPFFATAALFFWASFSSGADFNIGPGQTYSAIGDVPWELLDPGDSVYIHWRSEPYQEKWVIGRSGSEGAPIVVSGVKGPDGELPIISGENATTRTALDYTNEVRGLIKVGSSNIPVDTMPAYIVIENLHLRSARPPFSFTNDHGQQETYSNNAAAVYVEKAQHLTIRNCIIQDSGNGIFIGAFNGQTRDILIEKNSIFGNGIENSYYQHNTYTAAINITYQYNYMGALRTNAGGNNLKDRSAGLVVRYNWIENGNRQLDLVDAEDSDVLVDHPDYRKTHVYGNILLEDEAEGNSQMVHYGGDSGDESMYRKGTLYFYNNTLVSTRLGNTTMLRLSSNDEFADVYNNIVHVLAPGSQLALVAGSGQLKIRHNWLKTGYRLSHDVFTGVLMDDNSSIVEDDPSFEDISGGNYHLRENSGARDSGTAVDPDVMLQYPLISQYVSHTSGESRVDDGFLDIGAFEYFHMLPGDVDGSGHIDLADAILSLQVAAGLSPEQVENSADIDGDQKIGMAEALHGLVGAGGDAP